MPLTLRRPAGVTTWPVWSLPARLLTAVLGVELLVVALVAVDLALTPAAAYLPVLWVAALLAVAGMVHTETALGVERVRRRVTETPHIDLSSVWTFAAAVLLPPALACAVVVVLYGHHSVRVWQPSKVPAYRLVFSTATVLLAVHAAAAVVGYLDAGRDLDSSRGLVALLVALLAYTVVNTCLIVGVIVISAPNRTVLQVLGHGDEVVLELATLAMGALVATAITSASPLHAVLVLPPLVVLHRAVLVRQLEEAASTDSKTGLLNASAWHSRATRQLRRAQRNSGGAAVLILDLDHFKAVNDLHGHLAGDEVLSRIATALRGAVRDDDLVGRFGGEEFVVLLPGLSGDGDDRAELERVAERIRRSVDAMRVEVPTPDGPLTIDGLSVSVGGAVFPGDGLELKQLLEVADSALYAAKRAGRNAVRTGLHLHPARPGAEGGGPSAP